MGEAILTRTGGSGSGGSGGTCYHHSVDIIPSWLYNTNATFTVPKTGVYKITCVGAGGAGIQNTNNAGGAGGIGILVTSLNKSTNYSIVANNLASFGSLVTATNGKNGSSGGTGGSASGTNVIVYNGGNASSGYGGDVGVYIPGLITIGATSDKVADKNGNDVYYNYGYRAGGRGIFGLAEFNGRTPYTGNTYGYVQNTLVTGGGVGNSVYCWGCFAGGGGAYGGGGSAFASGSAWSHNAYGNGGNACVVIQLLSEE